MRSIVLGSKLLLALTSALLISTVAARDLSIITLAPGHFHAALFQREMLPGVTPEAFIYAPLDPDLLAHLGRVEAFNRRQDSPTTWRLHIYTGPDYFQRMLEERPGQVVIISGRNRGKIDRILSCVRSGLHVLADKPWIIEAEDLPKLRAALEAADAGRIVSYDAMTQRFEITAMIQRALVNDPDVFGAQVAGSLNDPAVCVTSLHYLLKEVGGIPNFRPPWFFDIREQGEGLTDVGTHLVDMVQWILFPEQALSCENDIQVLRAKRWPTILTRSEYERITGEKDCSRATQGAISRHLDYFCNNQVDYTLRGVHVSIQATWEFAAGNGQQETEISKFQGSRARIEVRQDPEHGYLREIYVVPASESVRAGLRAGVQHRLTALQKEWPGLAIEEESSRLRIVIPPRLRASHEAHFACVTQRFLSYVKNPSAVPAWEKQFMLAKYFVTTQGVALARQQPFTPSIDQQ